jgi:hypothetical protein
VTEDAAGARTGLDTTVSHSARIWNYWLGGTDNFAVDREAGDKVAEMLPIIVTQARAAHWNQVGTPQLTLRSPEQIARFFDGLDLLEPGMVPCSQWRPDISPQTGRPPPVDEFCGIARKP